MNFLKKTKKEGKHRFNVSLTLSTHAALKVALARRRAIALAQGARVVPTDRVSTWIEEQAHKTIAFYK